VTGIGTPGVQLNREAMQAATRAAADGYAQLTTLLTKMTGEVDELAASWQGAASGTFQKVFAEYADNATRFNAALQDVKDRLLMTHGVHTANEAESEKIFTAGINDIAQHINH